VAVLVQFAIGRIFGLGLIISGMSNPAKVLNFLDVGGILHGRRAIADVCRGCDRGIRAVSAEGGCRLTSVRDSIK
jgi:hypothetical protein